MLDSIIKAAILEALKDPEIRGAIRQAAATPGVDADGTSGVDAGGINGLEEFIDRAVENKLTSAIDRHMRDLEIEAEDINGLSTAVRDVLEDVTFKVTI